MPTEDIKRFLEEAKKVSELPEKETDILNLELDADVIPFIKNLAQEWDCTENDVIVAIILAVCNEKPQKIAEMIKEPL